MLPPAELIPRAEAIAQKIIANAPLAIQYAMEAVNHGLDLPLAEGLYLEATLFGVCCATEDKNEGTKAFLEKRAANVQGKVERCAKSVSTDSQRHRTEKNSRLL